MAFYESSEEILVSTRNYYFTIIGNLGGSGRRNCFSTIYLFYFLITVLKMENERKTKDVEAILAICTGLAIVFYLTDIKLFLIIAIVLGLATLLSKIVTAFIAGIWYKIAAILLIINSNLMLTLLFFLVLTPIALIARIFKKDDLQLKKKKGNDESYFNTRNHLFKREDLKHPF